MTTRKLTADWIYDGLGNALVNHVLIISDGGDVLDLLSKSEVSQDDIEEHRGALCPGFVNTHCHLELSHLKGMIPTGTGLIEFLKKVVNLRAVDQQTILKRIEQEDAYMWSEGIVAVGDISNSSDTVQTKRASEIYYHTFVEIFDFCQDVMADENWSKALEVYEEMPGAKSLVPHSPYSVSESLFHKIVEQKKNEVIISIHNQEMEPENELHGEGSPDLVAFLEAFGASYPDYIGGIGNAMDFNIQQLGGMSHVLFVHNTRTTELDIQKANQAFELTYWATCPSANLYIENSLPNYQAFRDSAAKVCIGTDSLSSNWRLSILEEIKTIKKYNSYIPTKELVQWATQNGAEALGAARFGSFVKGKKPGVNLIQDLDRHGELTAESKVKKIL